MHITDREKLTNTIKKSCTSCLSQKDRHSSDDHAFSTNPLFDTKLAHDGKQNAVLKETTTEGVKPTEIKFSFRYRKTLKITQKGRSMNYYFYNNYIYTKIQYCRVTFSVLPHIAQRETMNIEVKNYINV